MPIQNVAFHHRHYPPTLPPPTNGSSEPFARVVRTLPGRRTNEPLTACLPPRAPVTHSKVTRKTASRTRRARTCAPPASVFERKRASAPFSFAAPPLFKNKVRQNPQPFPSITSLAPPSLPQQQYSSNLWFAQMNVTPPGPQGPHAHQPSPQHPPQHRNYRTVPGLSNLPPMFSQNDNPQHQRAQHQCAQHQMPDLQTYVQNYFHYNFQSNCTVNITLRDGQCSIQVMSCQQSANRAPPPAHVNPIPPVAPVHPAGRTSHPAPTRQCAPQQRLPQPLGALPSVRSLPRLPPLTERPCKRSRLSARAMPTSNSSESEGSEDRFRDMRTRNNGSTSADVGERSMNDWEAVVDMYLHGSGAPDGVPLRDYCKEDGRRVNDRKLLEKRRTIGKTFEFLGASRFEAAIGYRLEGNLRRKQKMYNVIRRCRIVSAMRKAGEPVPDDFTTLAEMIDTRIRDKERAKEERGAKRTAEPMHTAGAVLPPPLPASSPHCAATLRPLFPFGRRSATARSYRQGRGLD